MSALIIYKSGYTWKYYLISLLMDEAYEVSEEEFFKVVGYDRTLVPMHYAENDINRQNFYLDNTLIGYRER